jgi:hypothetical protein
MTARFLVAWRTCCIKVLPGMDGVPVNAISKTLKGVTFPGPRWQKGFFDHGIRAEESYEQKWVYVRDNPVRAGLVRSAEDWPCAGEIARLSY